MIPNAALCPPHIRESIAAYVDDGRPTGGFLEAVLSNDLRASVRKADLVNLAALPHIVAYLDQNVSSGVWGSAQAVEKHLARKRREREGKAVPQ